MGISYMALRGFRAKCWTGDWMDTSVKTQNRKKCRSWKNYIGVHGQSLLSRHTPQYQRSRILVTQDFDIKLVQHCHALFYRGDIMRAVATNWFDKNLATRREGKGQSWDWVLWITLIRKDFKRFWGKKKQKKYINIISQGRTLPKTLKVQALAVLVKSTIYVIRNQVSELI